MNGVEAAASLFGSEESTSDPFAALGVASSPQPSSDELFFVNGAPNATEISSSTVEMNTVSGHAQPYTQPEPNFQQPAHASTSEGSNALAESSSAQTWYPDTSQGNASYAYGVQEQVSVTQNLQMTPSIPSNDPYNPYVPTSNRPMDSSPSAKSSHDSYYPAHNTTSNATTFAYPSYPHGSTTTSAPNSSSYASLYSSQTENVHKVMAPPVPAPVTTINRPKISNAYDPPFPPVPKYNRRTPSSRTGSSYQSYGVSHTAMAPSGTFTVSNTVPPLPSTRSPEYNRPPPPSNSWGVSGASDTTMSNSYPYGGNPAIAGLTQATPTTGQEYPLVSENLASGYRDAYTRSVAFPPADGVAVKTPPDYSSDPPAHSNSYQPVTTSPSPPPQTMRSSTAQPREDIAEAHDSLVHEQEVSVVESLSQTISPNNYGTSTKSMQIAKQYAPSQSFSPSQSPTMTSEHRASSPASVSSGYASKYNPYTAKSHANGHAREGASSPRPYSVHTTNGPPATKQYPSSALADAARNRSMSNGSIRSLASNDPYAPQQSRRQTLETDYGSHASQAYDHLAVARTFSPEVQEAAAPTYQTPYAPSPSLLGANDPLGRTSARVPVISFGFGGKLVTCFHGVASLNTGFDVALSSRNSTGIKIRSLKSLIPDSALDTSAASFPGPLFGDSGTSSGLVLTGVSSQNKTKKARVIKYLSERADELALGLRYFNQDSLEGRRAEDKLILMKLLKVMVEHDGRLTGTPQLDTDVRKTLVPRLENPQDGSVTSAPTFTTIADTQPLDISTASYGATAFATESQPSSVSASRPALLSKIQDFLLRGERRQACHYALDEKLWAHAMIIASSIDRDAWKEVVNEFLKNELGSGDVSKLHHEPSSTTPRWESLRVAYSLFSGQGAVAVQELIPQNLLTRGTNRPQNLTPVAPHLTPRTPNFSPPSLSVSVPLEATLKWSETLAMMLSNPLTPETSAALTGLGDLLAANQLYEAAHVCYLLSPQTSPMGGVGNPSARMVLVGSRNPKAWSSFARDSDPIIFTEIVEFALSLAPQTKGQEPFQGLAHLHAYRLIRAMSLVETGDMQTATKYCDAISASVHRNSPYITPLLLDQLKGLTDRISGVSHSDKSSSWMGAKLSKPSLDTIGGWLEGRFTKLVTGESETSSDDDPSKADRGFAGPFSHYSTISSTTPSARSSPQPSGAGLPPRSGSALAFSSSYAVQPQIDRASSAMDYVKRKPSPGPRIASASAVTTTFSTSTSFGQALGGSRTVNGYSPVEELVTPRPSSGANEDDTNVQEATWWGSTYEETSTTQTPTASTFLRVEDNAFTQSPDGFISLMDAPSYSLPPQSSARLGSQLPPAPEEDEEDLGLGNSRREKIITEDKADQPMPTPEPAKPAPPPESSHETLASTGGSWFSRWWKRSDAPGPTKASLGEESSFYYDKDLKRWVNKKAGETEAAKPAGPPPPPSRTQTASPAMVGSRPSNGSEASGPPVRSASAIDLSTSPPSKTVMRVRSNLVPLPESAPSTPTGTRLAPPGPPPGRPKSQASKRNIRNRYVDVFAQGA